MSKANCEPITYSVYNFKTYIEHACLLNTPFWSPSKQCLAAFEYCSTISKHLTANSNSDAFLNIVQSQLPGDYRLLRAATTPV